MPFIVMKTLLYDTPEPLCTLCCPSYCSFERQCYVYKFHLWIWKIYSFRIKFQQCWHQPVLCLNSVVSLLSQISIQPSVYQYHECFGTAKYWALVPMISMYPSRTLHYTWLGWGQNITSKVRWVSPLDVISLLYKKERFPISKRF